MALGLGQVLVITTNTHGWHVLSEVYYLTLTL